MIQQHLRDTVRPVWRFPWVGNSKPMRLVRKRLEWASQSLHPVLIKGETGTGQAWAAHWLHEQAGFSPATLSWVGPDQSQDLLWVESFPNPGSLVLQDIQDWTVDTRAECFGFLKKFENVNIPLRIIVTLVKQDETYPMLETDLQQALSLYPVELPNIRDNIDDWPNILQLFGLESWQSDEGLAAMRHYTWPRNWDELEDLVDLFAKGSTLENAWGKLYQDNISEWAEVPSLDAHLAMGSQFQEGLGAFFSAHQDREPSPGLYQRLLREMERPLLRQTLEYCQGNQVKAARILGLNRNTLHQKLKQHGLLLGPKGSRKG